MKILFIHQNFPGQFKFLAPALSQQGHEVVGMTMQDNVRINNWEGIQIVKYKAGRSSTPNIHPWVIDFETKVIRAEYCFRAALEMRNSGFIPDLIIAHPGWGENLFLKEIWPKAKLGIYCEFFYSNQGADVGFDPEFPSSDFADVCRLRLKNLHYLFQVNDVDAGISPTHWQASTFPDPLRSKITVIHDGIDTDKIVPNKNVMVTINGKKNLTREDEVITFVNRNLEPYRGYHIFMRSLPELLKRRPNLQVLIVGGDGVSYGSRPPNGQKWRDIFAAEVRPKINDIDWARIHFLGTISYDKFLPLLQLSKVHIYFTYPFVLGWSVLEAMSSGCAVIGSDTKPLQEIISHNETGRLVDFFDYEKLVNEICQLLDNPKDRDQLGFNARVFVQKNYDLYKICLPRQLKWIEDLLIQ